MSIATMDESGDTGLKLGKGSSDFFTIGMVLFQELAVAEACRIRIQELRQTLGMKRSGKGSTFHFWEMNPRRRQVFLSAVAGFAFQFYSCTIDKKRLSGKSWGKKAYMYERAGILTIDQALENLKETKLVFAATSGRKFDHDF